MCDSVSIDSITWTQTNQKLSAYCLRHIVFGYEPIPIVLTFIYNSYI